MLASSRLRLQSFYDPLSLTNFYDAGENALTLRISKTVNTNVLSELLDADFPAKIKVSAAPCTFNEQRFAWAPWAKASLNVRLLDLGASDKRQRGSLRFRMGMASDGRRGHGFEIDRRVAFLGLRTTTLYGNVKYRTNNKSEGEWKTKSSFGVHQEFKIMGSPLAARAGLTPEGDFVYELRV